MVDPTPYRQFVRCGMLTQMLAAANNEVRTKFTMLFLFTYVFLLRLPSEALPAIVANEPLPSKQTVVIVKGELVRVHLNRRKNKLNGSVLERTCWCTRDKISALCPTHTLGHWLKQIPCGCAPFAGISSAHANDMLRNFLRDVCLVSNSKEYKSHDIRRGHADDLRLSGASLVEILRASEWRSPAFMDYLNHQDLERDAVVQAHVEDSSSEDDV